MNNFRKLGKTITCTAPAGGVTSGGCYLIGALFVIASTTAAVGVQFEGVTEGVFNLTKLAGEGNLVEGQPVFWDVANSRCTIDESAGLPLGSVTLLQSPAPGGLTADTNVDVRLHGVSLVGRVLTLRKRLTIAAINAGAVTLIPALAGLKSRMHDCQGIAIGGAAGAVTTVDILGTQAAGSVKLAAFAQASLTQSTVLRPGIAGTTVLADGASFMVNDVNTAVQISKTGAAITTSTFIDVQLTYELEAA